MYFSCTLFQFVKPIFPLSKNAGKNGSLSDLLADTPSSPMAATPSVTLREFWRCLDDKQRSELLLVQKVSLPQ